MLQLGLPEKLRQQAARFRRSECFEVYSSASVGSIQDWLTRPKMYRPAVVAGNTWQIWHLACPQVVQYAWKHISTQVGAPKHIQGVCPKASCRAILWRGIV